MASQVIQKPSGPDTVNEIEESNSANIARNTLAEECNMPNNINTGRDNNGHFDQYKDLVMNLQCGPWINISKFIDEYPNVVNQRITDEGKIPLHIAAAAGHKNMVEKLADMSKESLEIQDNDGRIALHIAAVAGHRDIVEKLVHKMSKESLEIRDNDGRTALHIAAASGHKDIVEKLVHKMSKESLEIQDNDVRTALHLALAARRTYVAKTLVNLMSEESLKIKDNDGRTILHIAIAAGRMHIAEMLVKKMSEKSLEIQDNDSETALHIAVATGHEDIMEKLVDKMSTKSLEIRVKDGPTALHIAAAAGHRDIVAKLVEKMSKESLEIRDDDGRTALHLVAAARHMYLVEMLVDKMSAKSLEIQDNDGRTALHIAAAVGHTVRALVGKMKSLEIQDNDGRTALHIAVAAGHMYVVDMLVDKMLKERLEIRDNDGRTALHIAAAAGHDYIVGELVDKMSTKSLEIQDKDGRTALHIAAAAGHEDIVEELVDEMSTESLKIQDNEGWTALAETAFAGNYKMAKCLLRKNKDLVRIGNEDGRLPVVLAIEGGYIELARYLYSLSPQEDLRPEKGINGATLCTKAIYTRQLDIALDLIQRYRHLALALDKDKVSPLYALASTPNAFPSENRLVFWKRWIYSRIWIAHFIGREINEIHLNIEEVEKRQRYKVYFGNRPVLDARFHPLASYLLNLVLGVNDLYEMKLAHVESHKLLSHMCEEISISKDEQRKTGGVDTAIFRAIKEGNFEFVYCIVRKNPKLLWCSDDKRRTIFSSAVLYRQAKIFSLIYRLHVKLPKVYSDKDKFQNTILHMAGMSEASTRLTSIPSAALQMQRELQWFKEVESIVNPNFKEALNNQRLTPRELFTREHKSMRKAGQQQMKDTATSCTVVGALIVTIMFAAAFTVPGGNNQVTGLPMFLNEKLFKLFIVFDSLSLFSSATSILMFLGILTSSYAEEDFLKVLPSRMIIGLSTLFFSIAFMMIAFCAALLLMLRGRSSFAIPVLCLASVPVTLFVLMQFPSLINMISSTYGSSIFDRKMKRWF